MPGRFWTTTCSGSGRRTPEAWLDRQDLPDCQGRTRRSETVAEAPALGSAAGIPTPLRHHRHHI